MKNHIKKRRQFLKQIGLTALGVTAVPTSIFKLKTWAAAAANNSAVTNNYKALVCFYMFGGNDGFNMLVPKGTSEYGIYQTSRSNLALAQNELLSINPVYNQGMNFGLNPNTPGMQQLFESGKLSFICNVGTKLVNDTDITSYQNQENLPLSLFSHIDQTAQWQTAYVDQRSGIGWAGRIADLLSDTNTSQNISMNISLAGNTTFLRGNNTTDFSFTNQGVQLLRHYEHNHNNIPIDFFGQRTGALDSLYNHDYQDPFYNNFNSIMRTGIDANIEYSEALTEFENAGGLSTNFSSAPQGYKFSADLKMVANSIAIGPALGFNRQIFFVELGGFDNHDNLLHEHNRKMDEVSVGLTEFSAALEELNMQDNVVTFSMSDFGRTLTSNGTGVNAGSDHGWGSNAIVMGGSVIGKSLFGTYPSLSLDNLLNVGKGILIPSTASDLYFAELALWFGVPQSELPTIFPNLYRFYDTSSTSLPIGFLTV